MIGMTTAIVSRKPLVSHCAVPMVTPRSAISAGSATLMIVSLRIMTNAEPTSSQMTSDALAAGEVCGSAGAAGSASGRPVRWAGIGAPRGSGPPTLPINPQQRPRSSPYGDASCVTGTSRRSICVRAAMLWSACPASAARRTSSCSGAAHDTSTFVSRPNSTCQEAAARKRPAEDWASV